MKTKNLLIVGIINKQNGGDAESPDKWDEVEAACMALESKYSGRDGVTQCHKVVIDVGPARLTNVNDMDYGKLVACIPEETKLALANFTGQTDTGVYIYTNFYSNYFTFALTLFSSDLARLVRLLGFNDTTRQIRKMCLISCRTFKRLDLKAASILKQFHKELGDEGIHTTLAGYSRAVFVHNDGSKLASPLPDSVNKESGDVVKDKVFENKMPVTGDKYKVSEVREAIKIIWKWENQKQVAYKLPDSAYHDAEFAV